MSTPVLLQRTLHCTASRHRGSRVTAVHACQQCSLRAATPTWSRTAPPCTLTSLEEGPASPPLPLLHKVPTTLSHQLLAASLATPQQAPAPAWRSGPEWSPACPARGGSAAACPYAPPPAASQSPSQSAAPACSMAAVVRAQGRGRNKRGAGQAGGMRWQVQRAAWLCGGGGGGRVQPEHTVRPHPALWVLTQHKAPS